MQFENGGPSSFLPVQRIHLRFAPGFVKTGCCCYFEICPLPRKIL
jgi:hypothetical protein